MEESYCGVGLLSLVDVILWCKEGERDHPIGSGPGVICDVAVVSSSVRKVPVWLSFFPVELMSTCSCPFKFLKFDPVNFVPVNFVPAKFVPAKFVPVTFVPVKFASVKFVPAKFDPVKFVSDNFIL